MAEKRQKEMGTRSASSTSKKMNKGDQYLCEICGLQVNVDLCGEFLETQKLSCCGKPMEKKTES